MHHAAQRAVLLSVAALILLLGACGEAIEDTGGAGPTSNTTATAIVARVAGGADPSPSPSSSIVTGTAFAAPTDRVTFTHLPSPTLTSRYPGPAAATVGFIPSTHPPGAPTVPILTDEQQQRIIEIAVNESAVLALLRGQSFDATQVAVWTKYQTLELIGGVVTLAFPQPVTLEGEWLGMAYDCSEQAQQPGVVPYVNVPRQATYANVTRINVFVDLLRERVAGISPWPGAQLIGTPVVHATVTVLPSNCPGG